MAGPSNSSSSSNTETSRRPTATISTSTAAATNKVGSYASNRRQNLDVAALRAELEREAQEALINPPPPNTSLNPSAKSISSLNDPTSKTSSSNSLPSYALTPFEVLPLPRNRNFLSIEYPKFIYDLPKQDENGHEVHSEAAAATSSRSSHRAPPTKSPSLNKALKSLDPSNQSAHAAIHHLGGLISGMMAKEKDKEKGAVVTKRYDAIKVPVELRFQYDHDNNSGKLVEEENDELDGDGDVEMTSNGNQQKKLPSTSNPTTDTLMESFRHPIIGSLNETGNLVGVIKKRKWRRKVRDDQGQAENGKVKGKGKERLTDQDEVREEIVKEYTFDVIGISSHTARFRAMADFGFKPEIGEVQLQNQEREEVSANRKDQAGDEAMQDEDEREEEAEARKQKVKVTFGESPLFPETSSSIQYSRPSTSTVKSDPSESNAEPAGLQTDSPSPSTASSKGYPKPKNTLEMFKALVQMDYKELRNFRMVQDWEEGVEEEFGNQMKVDGEGGGGNENEIGNEGGAEINEKKKFKSLHMIPPPLFSQSATPWMYGYKQNNTSSPRIYPLPPSIKESYLAGNYQIPKKMISKLPKSQREKIIKQEKKIKGIEIELDGEEKGKGKDDEEGIESENDHDGDGEVGEIESQLMGIRFMNNKRIKSHAPLQMKLLENSRGVWRIKMSGPVPQAPNSSQEMNRSAADKEIMKKLAELFQLRPMWSRRGLMNQFSVDERKTLNSAKFNIYLSSYKVLDGPWRDALVRWGFDPRKDKESRFYQRLTWRVHKGSESTFVRPISRPQNQSASASGSDQENGRSEDGEEGEEMDGGEEVGKFRGRRKGKSKEIDRNSEGLEDPEASLSHVFNGTSIHHSNRIFHLADISDPYAIPYIQTSELLETPDPVTGWYTSEAFARIRKIVSHRVEYAEAEKVEEGERMIDEVMEACEAKLGDKDKEKKEGEDQDQDQEQDEERNQDEEERGQDIEGDVEMEEAEQTEVSTSNVKSSTRQGEEKAPISNPSSSKKKVPTASTSPERSGSPEIDLSNEAAAQLFREARKVVPKPRAKAGPKRKGKGKATVGDAEGELLAGDRVERSRKKKK